MSENNSIRRDFITLKRPGGGERQVHCRRAGSGPPLLLLHPSPLSSEALEPLMRPLASLAAVIAPDTPGYGFSDPLPQTPQNIRNYAQALKELLDALQLRSAGLYGNATGAQIAIEFSKMFPDAADFVILENIAHFEDAEREHILRHYFPDLRPRADGGHLLAAWRMARDMFEFFPWFENTPEARIDAPLSLEAVHAAALAQLQAGEDYHLAYRAAFINENFERIPPIPCPVRIIHRKGGLLQRYNRSLETIDWPEHIKVMRCGPEPGQRLEALSAAVRELTDDSRKAPPPPPPSSGRQRYLRLGGAQFRLQLASPSGTGKERGKGEKEEALLCLHDAGGAAEDLLPLMRERNPAGERLQIAPDLPGHGLSDPLDAEFSIGALADWLQQILQELSIKRCAIHACGLGAALACELRRRHPQSVSALHAHGAPPPPWSEDLAPELEPRWDGAHLLQAWSMLRERRLYRPWNRRDAEHRITEPMPSPAQLTRQLLHLFRAREAYPQALRRSCEYFADRGDGGSRTPEPPSAAARQNPKRTRNTPTSAARAAPQRQNTRAAAGLEAQGAGAGALREHPAQPQSRNRFTATGRYKENPS